MGGTDCAFNYDTMPSRDVCVIWLLPSTVGVSLTDEGPNLLILPMGAGGGLE